MVKKTSKKAERATRVAESSPDYGNRRKATFYLDAEDLALLEDERHRRRVEDGNRGADLSGLVREAIRSRYGKK